MHILEDSVFCYTSKPFSRSVVRFWFGWFGQKNVAAPYGLRVIGNGRRYCLMFEKSDPLPMGNITSATNIYETLEG